MGMLVPVFAWFVVGGVAWPTGNHVQDGDMLDELDPCSSYISLNEEWRNTEFVINSSYGTPACDRDMGGEWYRFVDLAGDVMPTFCVEPTHCGTHAPIWLNGSHPGLSDGVVEVPACAAFRENCCMWEARVAVKMCPGAFYVYRLPRPSVCFQTYCGHYHRPCSLGAPCRGDSCPVQGRSCHCLSGMQLAEDGSTCMDINECENGIGSCADICINMHGSFRCECEHGRVLAMDGRTCVDTGRCERNNGGCSHVCTTTGEDVHCECPPGLVLAKDNHTCQVPVHCSPNAIEVAVPKEQAKGLDLFLANVSCKGISNGSHINANFGIRSCGTTLQVMEDKIIASNVLTGIPKQGPGSNGDMIIRTNRLVIKIFCEFPRHGTVSLAFEPKSGNPVATLQGHSQGKFPIGLIFYHGGDGGQPVTAEEMPLLIKLHQTLHFGVEPLARLDGLESLVENCYATPRQSDLEPAKYFLIRNGCLVDHTVKRLPSSNVLSKHYAVQVFKFLGKETTVFVHCEVLLCRAGDGSSRCVQGCVRRVRRSALALVPPLHSTVLSGGPIVLRDE
uniref:oncoprotein-induced transcript 3 protein isoform X2 n=1 Tax=Myxine glutinosa TaxID=7769 RepID=UPI00358E931F